jgi:hypothetical protein
METVHHIWMRLVQNWNVAQQFPLAWMAATLVTGVAVRAFYVHRLSHLRRQLELLQKPAATGKSRPAAN